nr:cysteine-rich receptor-like protein kinase 10 [Tanacetum cinerariifolium]
MFKMELAQKDEMLDTSTTVQSTQSLRNTTKERYDDVVTDEEDDDTEGTYILKELDHGSHNPFKVEARIDIPTYDGTVNAKKMDSCHNKNLNGYIFDHHNKRQSKSRINQDQRETLDWSSIVDIIKGIANGLNYLHNVASVKLIHRDIKPQNILRDDTMVPKITDFGTVRDVMDNSPVTALGTIAVPRELSVTSLTVPKSAIFGTIVSSSKIQQDVLRLDFSVDKLH